MCMCFIRKFKVVEAGPPPDVKDHFKKYTDGATHMTAEQLRNFLVDVQADSNASIADAEKIIEQILNKRHHIAKFTRHTLTLDDFHHYLFSADLNPPIRENQVIYFFFWKKFLLVIEFWVFIYSTLTWLLLVNGSFLCDDTTKMAFVLLEMSWRNWDLNSWDDSSFSFTI